MMNTEGHLCYQLVWSISWFHMKGADDTSSFVQNFDKITSILSFLRTLVIPLEIPLQ